MECSNIKSQVPTDDHPPDDQTAQLEPLMLPSTSDQFPGKDPENPISATAEFVGAMSPPAASVYIRVPRPTNAFMIYANENRKCMAKQFPLDSNKEISKRLGQCWKKLDPGRKAAYYDLAKQVDADHKKKYPNYVYNPKEARIRKALRDATREKIMAAQSGMTSNTSAQQRAGASHRRPAQPWMLPDHDDQIMMSPSEPGGAGGGALRAGMASPMCGTGFPMGLAPMGAGSAYPGALHHPHAAYINNPLAQLQHQTDLWNPYHHKSQTKSPQDAAAYLMSHNHLPLSPYAHIPPISFSPIPTPPPPSQNNDHKAIADQLIMFTNGMASQSDGITIRTNNVNGHLADNNNKSPPLHRGDDADDLKTAATAHLRTAKMELPESPPELDDIDEQRPQPEEEGGGSTSSALLLLNSVSENHDRLSLNNGKVEYDPMVKVGPMTSSSLITREGYQQQEKIILQNPFDMPPSPMMVASFGQQHRKKKLVAPYPVLPASHPLPGPAAGAPSFTYSISEVELRKHFILKYAQNYNYDHMELMLQQPLGPCAVSPGRAISYHYVTLPVVGSPCYAGGASAAVGVTLPPTSGVQSINIELSNKEMYLIQQGQVTTQASQALNLSADLK